MGSVVSKSPMMISEILVGTLTLHTAGGDRQSWKTIKTNMKEILANSGNCIWKVSHRDFTLSNWAGIPGLRSSTFILVISTFLTPVSSLSPLPLASCAQRSKASDSGSFSLHITITILLRIPTISSLLSNSGREPFFPLSKNNISVLELDPLFSGTLLC